MPRSTQSRESGIVNYFKTADLAIAQVVLGLSKDAVAERKAKSFEARERALAAQKDSLFKRKATPPAAPARSAPPAAAKPKGKRKTRKSRVKRQTQTAAQIEDSLAGGGNSPGD